MIEIDKYPKSREKLLVFTKTWLISIRESIVEAFNKEFKGELPEGLDLSEISDEDAKNAMNGMVQNNIRSLYNFFDENKIYVAMDVDGLPEDGVTFVSRIFDKEFESKIRVEAETKGFEEAFKILEEKL